MRLVYFTLPLYRTIKQSTLIIATMTTNINNSDYTNIASLIFANGSVDNETIEVEYTTNGNTLFLTVDHQIECVESIGGSYSSNDYETISTVAKESMSIVEVACYDADGDTVGHNFNNDILTSILNNLIN